MKLQRIELSNFRCYTDFTLELGGESVLVIGPERPRQNQFADRDPRSAERRNPRHP